jgi:hypothetical protein
MPILGENHGGSGEVIGLLLDATGICMGQKRDTAAANDHEFDNQQFVLQGTVEVNNLKGGRK